MDLLIGVVIGLLVGWLVEWLIDWRFWQLKNEALREALGEAENQIAVLRKARQQDSQVRQELARVKSQLASRQPPNINLLQQKLARAEAQIEALQEARQHDKHLRDRFAKGEAQTRRFPSGRKPARDQESVSDWHEAEVTVWEESEYD